MTFKLRSRALGGHVLTTLFVGVDADHLQNSGDLVMGAEQWCVLTMVLSAGCQTANTGGDLGVQVLREYDAQCAEILHDYVRAVQAADQARQKKDE